jgi:hypothetical protein
VAPFVKQLGVSFPIAQDLTWTVAERYRVNRLPSSFLVDRQGTLVALAIGPRDWDTTPAHAVMESLLR